VGEQARYSCAAQIQWCRQIDKERRRRRRSQIILNTGPAYNTFSTYHFFSISFSIFQSKNKKISNVCTNLCGICKIVGTIINGTYHLGGNTSKKGWRVERIMGNGTYAAPYGQYPAARASQI
jgi:hypothetical protein